MGVKRPYEEVLGVNVLVFGEVEVLLRNEDTLWMVISLLSPNSCCFSN